jgi:ABC-2 type transport system permease protein
VRTFFVLLRRNLRATWAMPVWIFLSLVYPAMWLLLFGGLLGGLDVSAGASTVDYVTFFAPGMVAATTVFGALFAGFGILVDRDSGVLDRVLATQASRLAVIAAYVVQSLSAVLLQAAVILLVSAAMGADLDWSPGAIGRVIAIVLALGFTLSSVSHLMALVIPRQDALIATVNFLSLPLLCTSSVLFPISEAPGWLSWLATLNPVHHGGELMKAASIPGYEVEHVLARGAYLVATGALFLGLASITIKRSA